MTRTLPASLAAALLSLACGSRPAQPADAPPPSAAAGASTGSVAHVSAATTLRREPSEAAKAKGPGGKDVPNALAVLQRGEKVTVLEAREEWARVRGSDDREGWLRRAALFEGDGVVEATVLAPADVFDRPDLLAANARRKVDPGTLLLVARTKPPFSEVNVSSGPNAWVLSDRLATGEREVSVAKLAEKARWLRRSGKDDEAKQILALARERFADVPLVELLAAELGEAPAAVVPTAAPAPQN
jgi:SH3-like domain-containing protein